MRAIYGLLNRVVKFLTSAKYLIAGGIELCLAILFDSWVLLLILFFVLGYLFSHYLLH